MGISAIVALIGQKDTGISMKFVVACSWAMSAEVEAETLEEAIGKVESEPALPTGEYVADSFEVNQELTLFINREQG